MTKQRDFHRCIRILGLVSCSLLYCLNGSAQQTDFDTVTIWNTQANQARSYHGKIVSYDANELKLQLVSGREQSLPAGQIIELSSHWNPDYVKAEGYLSDRRFERAAISYRQAYSSENRDWVKHRITARMVLCEQNEGNWHVAANQFFNTLLSQQTDTPYLSAAPIAWHTISASGELLHRGRELMRSANPLKQLVGASWLLTSPYRSDAIVIFKQLEQHSDKTIALLAVAQTWRTRIPIAKPDDVERWEQAIGQLPKDLRAGPLHILAQMQRSLRMHEEAVLTWMRIPILYQSNHHLASEATYASVRELMSMTQYSEALILCKELEHRYSDTTAGTQAERLEIDIEARIRAKERLKQEGDSS